jgi:hypothetical protein
VGKIGSRTLAPGDYGKLLETRYGYPLRGGDAGFFAGLTAFSGIFFGVMLLLTQFIQPGAPGPILAGLCFLVLGASLELMRFYYSELRVYERGVQTESPFSVRGLGYEQVAEYACSVDQSNPNLPARHTIYRLNLYPPRESVLESIHFRWAVRGTALSYPVEDKLVHDIRSRLRTSGAVNRTERKARERINREVALGDRPLSFLERCRVVGLSSFMFFCLIQVVIGWAVGGSLPEMNRYALREISTHSLKGVLVGLLMIPVIHIFVFSIPAMVLLVLVVIVHGLMGKRNRHTRWLLRGLTEERTKDLQEAPGAGAFLPDDRGPALQGAGCALYALVSTVLGIMAVVLSYRR